MQRYIVLIIFVFSINLFADVKAIDKMVEDFLQKSEKESRVSYKQKGNFIQLGAFSEIKPVKLIERLQQAGYKVRLKTIIRNSQKVNLLLAGPYLTQEQTEKYLHKLRTIVSGAFIYRP